ncbi:MAG: AAA family ATPase [Candidatus Omnitrophica bacterium]|nr:AAA family ATPase [Candidatus Omnitrophota bacterium]
MKIAITGKGGSGKTTVAAGLSLLFDQEGKEVIAVDCDPDTNLGITLGVEGAENIVPISEMKELIARRTEVESLDKPQTFFKLNPKVDDIPDKFSIKFNNIRLLVMGKVQKASGGCMCPENTFIKLLISHLVLAREQVVILDMVAGTEHLGRATAKSVDVFIIVVEPTQISINTALRIKSLTEQLGIKKIYFVANKIQEKEDKEFLNQKIKDGIIGYISFNKTLQNNRGRFSFDNQLEKEFEGIYQSL